MGRAFVHSAMIASYMEHRVSPSNPRQDLLRREVEQKVLIPFRSHGWSAEIMREVDCHDCTELTAKRGTVEIRIAVLYSSSGISNSSCRELLNSVNQIFFNGQPYVLDSFASGVAVPVESLDDFFAFLVDLNKQVEPDRSPAVILRRPAKIRRLTTENPLDAPEIRPRPRAVDGLLRRRLCRPALPYTQH